MSSLSFHPHFNRSLKDLLLSLTKLLVKGTYVSVLLLLSLDLSAQPGIEWEGRYGGGALDEARSVQETDDGGYIVAGGTESDSGDVSGNNGFRDYWVLKLDSLGNIQWEGNYGGSNLDQAHSIRQTDDGGYIVAGYSHSSDGDVSGNNGLSDFWLLKLDSSGAIQWDGNYGGSGYDQAHSVQQTTDDGFIVGGYSSSLDGDVSGNYGERDYWVVKLDSVGNLEWESNYGGSTMDEAHSLQQTNDGGYVVGGFSESDDGDVSGNNGSNDFWVLKLDPSGTIEWKGNYGGSESDVASSIDQTADDGFIVGGYSSSQDGDVSGNYGDRDYWVVKMDSIGNLEWESNYGGGKTDWAHSLQQTDDGGYIVAGTSVSDSGDISGNNGGDDYWVLKLDGSGSIVWEENYGGSDVDKARSVHQCDKGYILTGFSKSDSVDRNYWVVKIEGSGPSGIVTNDFDRRWTLYPNPAKERVTIELDEPENPVDATVRDLTGRKILERRIEDPSHFQLELGDKPGLYFVELEFEDGKRTVRKVVKE